MKYTIMGFSQRQAQELRLDTTDLLILRWIADFAGTDRIKKIMVEGRQYFWIQYAGLLADLPILNMKKDTLYRRLAKLECKKVLERVTYRENGTYSLYRFGEQYEMLVDDAAPTEKNPTPTEKNPDPYGKNSRGGTEKNPDQKINLLINPSTKNNINVCASQNDESDKQNNSTYTPEFESFWKVYPRKKEKLKAYRCYRAAIKDGYTPEQLKHCAEVYASECKGLQEQYIKHASTFLSNRDKPYADYLNQTKIGEYEGGLYHGEWE